MDTFLKKKTIFLKETDNAVKEVIEQVIREKKLEHVQSFSQLKDWFIQKL
jgi:hypothetical protein